MPSRKDTVLAILFITLASAIMMFAVMQLDSSAWAEGVRADSSAEITPTENEATFEGEDELAGIPAPLRIVVTSVASLLKITLLMGIPGLITLAVLRRADRSKDRPPAGAAPG